MSIRPYFLIPKRGRKYSPTNSYIFAMALFFMQDDHLTAGAWAACGQARLISSLALCSARSENAYVIYDRSSLVLFLARTENAHIN